MRCSSTFFMNTPDLQTLHPVSEVWEHVYEVYSTKNVHNQDLGYVDRTNNKVLITLPNSLNTLTITQSLSQLSANSSSTGFVCWKTSQLVVDWILHDRSCFLYEQFHNSRSKKLDILELGSGVSGISASLLAPSVRRYVCSDQKPILKLLQHNLIENAQCTFNSQSLGQISKSDITLEAVEFDWEHLDQGLQNYHRVTEPDNNPDLVLAFDTIYNEYLIEPFLKCLTTVMGSSGACLMGIQMRDDLILESFLNRCIEYGLSVYIVPDSGLTEQLRYGFVVYYMKKSVN